MERGGESKTVGRLLLEQVKLFFGLRDRVRDGTLSRIDFQSAVQPIRSEVKRVRFISVERKIEGRVAGAFPAYRDPKSQVSIRAKEHRPTQPAFFNSFETHPYDFAPMGYFILSRDGTIHQADWNEVQIQVLIMNPFPNALLRPGCGSGWSMWLLIGAILDEP